jgi:xylan 1,4-beta-xylosidase
MSTVKTIESIVHCDREAGSFFSFPCAVMGDHGCNLIPAGVRLQRLLEQISDGPLLRRTMNLLSAGIGIDGGTNVYHEDAEGRPVYDFTLLDQIVDVIANPRSVPFVGLSFMPDDLSDREAAAASGPGHLPPEALAAAQGQSWARIDRLPPKDYHRWYDLVYAVVRHAVERYGQQAVASWYWDFWNEPDLPFYWRASPEAFFKTYDYAAAAVKAALPEAKIGGCGPADPRHPIFRAFLEHCASGHNDCTGQTGTPIDFITFHLKGGPTGKQGIFTNPWVTQDYPHRNPSLRHMLNVAQAGLEIIDSIPAMRGRPVFLTECDIDWGTPTSIYHNPNMHYRNSEYYAAFQCAMTRRMLDLRARFPDNPIEALFLDTFLIPGHRLFEGQRTLVTGEGVEKPILNALRMVGRLGNRRLSASEPPDTTVEVLATVGQDASVQVMAVNFQEEFDDGEPCCVRLRLQGLPPGVWQCAHYRIDHDHSNAYTLWLKMGRPLVPDAGQLAVLQSRQGLEEFEGLFTLDSSPSGAPILETVLPRCSASLWVLLRK